ncbi:cuticle protein-like [Penaeus monodon]|uniref:cuticle protein-like n=1 Tax=Penaeus monodon TaxID=6687 RepID=UPI0018A6EC2A|nr:cuticle protein-like [Penaeus monodon]
MNTRLVLLLALAAVAASDSQPSSFYGVPRVRTQVSDDSAETSSESRHIYRSHDRSDEDSVEYGPAKYDFDWAVKHDYSGNHFGHHESRDGDYTQGSYYVQLPDTRLQTVKYYVDGDSGYVAEVEYEGEAQHPESEEYRVSRGRYSAPDSSEEDSSETVVRAPSRFYGSPL